MGEIPAEYNKDRCDNSYSTNNLILSEQDTKINNRREEPDKIEIVKPNNYSQHEYSAVQKNYQLPVGNNRQGISNQFYGQNMYPMPLLPPRIIKDVVPRFQKSVLPATILQPISSSKQLLNEPNIQNDKNSVKKYTKGYIENYSQKDSSLIVKIPLNLISSGPISLISILNSRFSTMNHLRTYPVHPEIDQKSNFNEKKEKYKKTKHKSKNGFAFQTVTSSNSFVPLSKTHSHKKDYLSDSKVKKKRRKQNLNVAKNNHTKIELIPKYFSFSTPISMPISKYLSISHPNFYRCTLEEKEVTENIEIQQNIQDSNFQKKNLSPATMTVSVPPLNSELISQSNFNDINQQETFKNGSHKISGSNSLPTNSCPKTDQSNFRSNPKKLKVLKESKIDNTETEITSINESFSVSMESSTNSNDNCPSYSKPAISLENSNISDQESEFLPNSLSIYSSRSCDVLNSNLSNQSDVHQLFKPYEFGGQAKINVDTFNFNYDLNYTIKGVDNNAEQVVNNNDSLHLDSIPLLTQSLPKNSNQPTQPTVCNTISLSSLSCSSLTISSQVSNSHITIKPNIKQLTNPKWFLRQENSASPNSSESLINSNPNQAIPNLNNHLNLSASDSLSSTLNTISDAISFSLNQPNDNNCSPPEQTQNIHEKRNGSECSIDFAISTDKPFSSSLPNLLPNSNLQPVDQSMYNHQKQNKDEGKKNINQKNIQDSNSQKKNLSPPTMTVSVPPLNSELISQSNFNDKNQQETFENRSHEISGSDPLPSNPCPKTDKSNFYNNPKIFMVHKESKIDNAEIDITSINKSFPVSMESSTNSNNNCPSYSLPAISLENSNLFPTDQKSKFPLNSLSIYSSPSCDVLNSNPSNQSNVHQLFKPYEFGGQKKINVDTFNFNYDLNCIIKGVDNNAEQVVNNNDTLHLDSIPLLTQSLPKNLNQPTQPTVCNTISLSNLSCSSLTISSQISNSHIKIKPNIKQLTNPEWFLRQENSACSNSPELLIYPNPNQAIPNFNDHLNLAASDLLSSTLNTISDAISFSLNQPNDNNCSPPEQSQNIHEKINGRECPIDSAISTDKPFSSSSPNLLPNSNLQPVDQSMYNHQKQNKDKVKKNINQNEVQTSNCPNQNNHSSLVSDHTLSSTLKCVPEYISSSKTDQPDFQNYNTLPQENIIEERTNIAYFTSGNETPFLYDPYLLPNSLTNINLYPVSQLNDYHYNTQTNNNKEQQKKNGKKNNSQINCSKKVLATSTSSSLLRLALKNCNSYARKHLNVNPSSFPNTHQKNSHTNQNNNSKIHPLEHSNTPSNNHSSNNPNNHQNNHPNNLQTNYLKNHPNPNIFPNFNPNIYSNMHPNMHANMHPNMHPNMHLNMHINMHPNVHPNICHNIRPNNHQKYISKNQPNFITQQIWSSMPRFVTASVSLPSNQQNLNNNTNRKQSQLLEEKINEKHFVKNDDNLFPNSTQNTLLHTNLYPPSNLNLNHNSHQVLFNKERNKNVSTKNNLCPQNQSSIISSLSISTNNSNSYSINQPNINNNQNDSSSSVNYTQEIKNAPQTKFLNTNKHVVPIFSSSLIPNSLEKQNLDLASQSTLPTSTILENLNPRSQTNLCQNDYPILIPNDSSSSVPLISDLFSTNQPDSHQHEVELKEKKNEAIGDSKTKPMITPKDNEKNVEASNKTENVFQNNNKHLPSFPSSSTSFFQPNPNIYNPYFPQYTLSQKFIAQKETKVDNNLLNKPNFIENKFSQYSPFTTFANSSLCSTKEINFNENVQSGQSTLQNKNTATNNNKEKNTLSAEVELQEKKNKAEGHLETKTKIKSKENKKNVDAGNKMENMFQNNNYPQLFPNFPYSPFFQPNPYYPYFQQYALPQKCPGQKAVKKPPIFPNSSLCSINESNFNGNVQSGQSTLQNKNTATTSNNNKEETLSAGSKTDDKKIDNIEKVSNTFKPNTKIKAKCSCKKNSEEKEINTDGSPNIIDASKTKNKCSCKQNRKKKENNTDTIPKILDTAKAIKTQSSLKPKINTPAQAFSMPSLIDDPVQQNDSNSNQPDVGNLKNTDSVQKKCHTIDLTVDHLVPSNSPDIMPQPIKQHKKHKEKTEEISKNNGKGKKRPHSPDENSKPILHSYCPCKRKMTLKSGHPINPEISEETLVAYYPWTHFPLPNRFPFHFLPPVHNNISKMIQQGLSPFMVNPMQNHASQQNITINNNIAPPPEKRKCSRPTQEKVITKECSFENPMSDSSFTHSKKALQNHNEIIEPVAKYIVEKVGDSYEIRVADDPTSSIRNKRSTFADLEVVKLEELFARNQNPNPDQRNKLCQQTGLNDTEIRDWFRAKRAKLKHDSIQLKKNIV